MLLSEVENVINCWPLTYISDNKDEIFNAAHQLMHRRQPNEKCFLYEDIDQVNDENAQ